MAIAISEQLSILAELQKIDLQIHELKVELAEQPEQQKAQDQEFEKKKVNLKAAEEEYKAAQMKQKSKEGDLASKEEKVKKLQGQLYQLKTNKEYSAMELEIKGLQADKSVLEEEILISFDAVEAAKAKVAKEKELLSVEEKKHKETTDILKKKAADIQAEVQSFEEKRKNYTPNIDPKILSQYEKILKGRDGLAIVPVRGNSCGGCNLGLPPQFVNELQMHDKLMYCESCARLLYWAP